MKTVFLKRGSTSCPTSNLCQPPLHPGTREPVGPDDLAPLFPMALIGQEMTADPWVDIPGEVLDVLRAWRPTPLVRARRLEKALDTPARIYYKDESVSPAGSHKPNTAVPQAFYNKAEGIRGWRPRPVPANGAVHWRTPRRVFELECKVYMVRASFEQKPYRRVMMEVWGAASCLPPSTTPIIRARSARPSATPCATPGRADTHYSLGSVLNHVLCTRR